MFLKKTIRLLGNSSNKENNMIKYWLGLHLQDYFQDMAGGPHAEVISYYYRHMRLLFMEALVLGDVT